mgnify:CR=1 FL=1
MLNLLQNLYKEEHSFKEAAIDFTTKEGDILGSDKISGLEIRLSHVIIKDNKTAKIFPFPGLAKIYFLTLVISDVENQMINFIVWLAIGGVIGWLASLVMKTDGQQGIILNIVVGIVGALISGWLFGGGINEAITLRTFLFSLIGAVILLAIVNLFTRKSIR